MLFKNSNKLLKYNGKLLQTVPPTPTLPPYTLRLKYKDGVTPTFSKGTGVQVSSSPNIWDLTYENSDWGSLLKEQYDLLEVIDGNTSGVVNMSWMFWKCNSLVTVSLFDTSKVTSMGSMFSNCTSLPTVPLFDTSSVTSMLNMFMSCTSLSTVPLFNTSNVTSTDHMFYNCTSLTNIPLFDTSSIGNIRYMFNGCTNVQSGALALYQQASTQTNPPWLYEETFTNCGRNTITGRSELAQIPSSWGGTGA